MIIIPGILISIVTFPGVIIHELAHQIFCYLCKVPVYEVKYFQFKNPNGYVAHEKIDSPLKNLIIAIGPFFINTLLGAIILFTPSMETAAFAFSTDIVNILLYWLGISIIMHAFPSTGDAQNIVENVLKSKEVNIFIKILATPIIGLIYLGAIGSAVWLDLGYALLIAYLVPKLIYLFI
jgi:hypothetical protein